MCRNERFLKLALRYAYDNRDYGGVHPVAAVITQGNRIITYGVNSQKTHPLATETFLNFLHAEQHALSLAGERANGGTIYVARWRSTGPGLAKPCMHCMPWIKHFGIRRVVWTNSSKHGVIDYTLKNLN